MKRPSITIYVLVLLNLLMWAIAAYKLSEKRAKSATQGDAPAVIHFTSNSGESQ